MTVHWQKPIVVLGNKAILAKTTMHSRTNRTVLAVWIDSESSRHILEGENIDEVTFKSIISSLVIETTDTANKSIQATR